MGNYNEFFNELIEQDTDLKKEVELLDLKYLLIEELLQYRKDNKLSQTDFAKLIDVKQQAISRFEKGEVDPRLSFVSKVVLGMKKEVSLSDKDYIKTNQKLRVLKINQKKPGFNKLSFDQFDLAI